METSLKDRGFAIVKMALAAGLAVLISSTDFYVQAIASGGGALYAVAPALGAAITELLTWIKDKFLP